MLPTFVIGLREGLEAALIVGIIAAFLRKAGRRDLLRWVFLGVAAAVLLCVAVGVVLDTVSQNLPQRQQEGLETLIGILAVAMVTYMVVWMKRHSRELKGQLEGLAADAMESGRANAGWTMVAMAFLAVLREGFETVVFLLAAFDESGSGTAAAVGAVVGLAVAVALGYGIYRGGVHINLSRFFRATGLVLVLVAAGLVVNALHTAHEAGWLDAGQGSTVNLTWLVRPGSVQSSLLTGMLGVQSRPVVIEVVGWLLYLVPVGLYVAWPSGRAVPRALLVKLLAGTAVAALLGAGILALAAPDAPASHPTTTAGRVTARVVGPLGTHALVRTPVQHPVSGEVGTTSALTLRAAGQRTRSGVTTDLYTAAFSSPGGGTSARLGSARVARLNGGRLPLGTHADASGRVPATYADRRVLTVLVEPRTARVVDLRWTESVHASVRALGDSATLARPVASAVSAMPVAGSVAAYRAAHRDVASLDRRAAQRTVAVLCLALALLALLGLLACAVAARPARRPVARAHPRSPVSSS